MKLRLMTSVFTVGVGLMSAIAMFDRPSQAQNSAARGFYCDTSSGTPVTMYQSANGNREPWIRWVSNTFAGSGYNPMTRCQEVSGRLETYRRNKQLKYITVGSMNGQRVVCTASQINGRCENLIFTLKPGQEPVRTLRNLLAWREGQAGTPSLTESENLYIDVRERLGEDADSATPAPVMAPSNAQPTMQQPSNGSSREL